MGHVKKGVEHLSDSDLWQGKGQITFFLVLTSSTGVPKLALSNNLLTSDFKAQHVLNSTVGIFVQVLLFKRRLFHRL